MPPRSAWHRSLFLFREQIAEPLGLDSASYQPQGEIGGPHPRDYSVQADSQLIDATGWYRVGNGAGAGIVASAADEAAFLKALMRGELLEPTQLDALKTPPSIGSTYALGLVVDAFSCVGTVYRHGGTSYATTSSVVVAPDGTRVAVILLNGHTLASGFRLDPRAGRAAENAARKLFCAA